MVAVLLSRLFNSGLKGSCLPQASGRVLFIKFKSFSEFTFISNCSFFLGILLVYSQSVLKLIS